MRTNVSDLEQIVAGAGCNWEKRYEFGFTQDAKTRAIRASQGHSLGSGVDDDALPIVEDVYYLGHAATRSAADHISATGLNRQQKLHVHFYECNRYGHLWRGTVPHKAEVM